MDSIIIGLSDYYNWLPIYCQYVVFEYERFLYLVNIEPNLICPNNINRCWQYHILDIRHYYIYCRKKFNKVIVHLPQQYIRNEYFQLKFQGEISFKFT